MIEIKNWLCNIRVARGSFMKRSKAFLLSFSLLALFFLSSCDQGPYFIFSSFSQYQTDDGVLILNSEFDKMEGTGKIKINEEYVPFYWHEYHHGYELDLYLENKDTIRLDFSSIKIDDGVYSKEKIQVKNVVETYGNNVSSKALGDWSSNLSKIRELSDEEIDPNLLMTTCFYNDDLRLSFCRGDGNKFESPYVSHDYTLAFLEGNRFKIVEEKITGKAEGSYAINKKFLYLTFEEDNIIGIKGKTIPFALR